jgi:rod shape-determining protein MreC
MLVITLVTASLVTITIDYKQGSSGPLAALGKAALSVIAPMQEGVTRVFHPVAQFFSSLAELPSLRSQNEQLRARVRSLEANQSQVVSLESKVASFETLFNMKTTLLSSMDTTGARVIASGVSNFEWSIIIDKGSSDGIKVNDPVVADRSLVGHVIDVTPTSSKVQLVVDPDSRVAARLQVSRETGLLSGRGNQDLAMEFVVASTDVQPNEGVETAGYQNGLYPPGIPIGTVASVETTPGSLTKTVTVHPTVNFSTLDVVLVVLGPRSR